MAYFQCLNLKDNKNLKEGNKKDKKNIKKGFKKRKNAPI